VHVARVMLRVFKDSIRLTLGYMRDPKWNATYNPYTEPWPEHFEHGKFGTGHAHHCFNAIRESLQCTSDLTPIVFQYDEEHDVVLTRGSVVHTCKNFEAVSESWDLAAFFYPD